MKTSNAIPDLSDRHVVVVGVGGLGCPAAAGLAAGGVGKLTLVDPDRVELSNLPRQLLHGDDDLGRPKVESGAHSLRGRFGELEIETVPEAFGPENASDLLAGADFLLDATDGIEAKLVINDAAIRQNLPFCYAGVVGLSGQVMVTIPGRTPCLRCLFPGVSDGDDLPTCSRTGIVGPMAGLFGSLQAGLTLAYLAGDPSVAGRLISFDRRSDRWRNIELHSAPRCTQCSVTTREPRGEDPRWAM